MANSAGEMAKLPRFYVMDLDKGMAETVAPEMPSVSAIAGFKWLTEERIARLQRGVRQNGIPGRLELVPGESRCQVLGPFWE